MRRKIVIGGSAAVVLLAATLYFGFGSGRTSSGKEEATQRAIQVSRGDLELSVSADGIIQPINKVELKSKASGQILEMNFVEGQTVKKGDLLIALDQTTARNDYDQAKADLELAEATALQQSNNDRRSEELSTKGLISQQDRDAARVDYVRAKSSLVKAKAVLSSADERLRDTRIHAPISGVILTKAVEVGQIISSGVSNVGGGTVLATLANMDEVYVEVNVDEVDIGRVGVDQSVTVTADAFPDNRYPGEVIRIAPQGTTQQNVTVFPVLVQVQNKGGRLKAGMSASADIEIFRKTDVLLLPNEALTDPRSPQGRALLEELRDSSRTGRNNLDSASRARFAERMGLRRGGEGGGFQGFQNSNGSRRREGTQSRRRIVMVKESEKIKPKFVTIGESNFDNTEIVDGLEEGDEVYGSTVSRARAAQEELNERIRSRSAMGGGSGRVR
ncbi:MAG TPA: efflux RND transporter periplasmic adaptor subunit [Bacteroidota bacterium]